MTLPGLSVLFNNPATAVNKIMEAAGMLFLIKDRMVETIGFLMTMLMPPTPPKWVLPSTCVKDRAAARSQPQPQPQHKRDFLWFRLLTYAYAPRGCVVRADEQTKGELTELTEIEN